MEIHKPKPIHSWRDFLKEVGTIVLGVCIALAAEQTVEYFHWRHEVEIARQALKEEITSNDRFYVRRIALSPCTEKQEREAAAILDSLEGKGKAATFTSFHRGAGSLLLDSEWQSQRSAQVLTHFPHAELALMNRYYAQAPSMTAWMEEERVAWSELSVLQNPPARLEPSGIARLRGQLDRVHRVNYLIVLNAYRMLKLSDQAGIDRPKLERGTLDSYCSATDEKTEADSVNLARKP